MSVDLIGYLYAATVAAGGVIGYTKTGSIPSIGAGPICGFILGYGAHLNSQGPPGASILQFGTSLVLAGVMGSRFGKSGKFMLAGLICLISCAAAMRILVSDNKYLPVVGSRN